MRRILLFIGAMCLCAAVLHAQKPGFREIQLRVLRDKIAGGWAGQMIGVSYGAPTEFRSNSKILEGDLPKWTPDRVSNSLRQDDLYVDMTFAKVLDDKGLDATSEDFGNLFREAKYGLWHANLAARRNLKRGVPAAKAGMPEFNAHAMDIDFQIEADFIGLMAPGLPQWGNDMAWRAGRVMNYGDGIYGGMFVSGMYSAAFFESDPHRLVEAGLAVIPAKSSYAMLIRDLIAWHKQYPKDWKKVWNLVEDKWNTNDPCPDGALKPFNIDAKLNGAYIALGLLFGDGDFGKTIEISTRSGQDSDCNPASAAGVLGVALGLSGIPEEWKGGIPAISDQKFAYTDFSFNSIVESTYKRTINLIQLTGGRIENDRAVIKVQAPQPAKYETWNYGKVAERISTADARWTFKGEWKGAEKRSTKTASLKGSEASVKFSGTGAIVVGPYLPTGGKADVYLDGRLHRTVDSNSDEKDGKGGEAVWHAFGLKNGEHTVRLVVRGEPAFAGPGTDVAIDDLVVFK